MDGARLWNAVVVLGTPAAELLAAADSATFCLSKGLSCPVGSVVVGSVDFIGVPGVPARSRVAACARWGSCAAPGLVALSDGPEGMIERLAEDHANARYLAEGLAALDGIRGLDPERVRTNYVIFDVRPRSDGDAHTAREAFMAETESRGVAYIRYPGGRVRALTHYGIDRADIERSLAVTREALAVAGLTAVAV